MHFSYKTIQNKNPLNDFIRGAWMAQSFKWLPSAQVTTLGSWDSDLPWASSSAGTLLLPVTFPLACALYQYIHHFRINKFGVYHSSINY